MAHIYGGEIKGITKPDMDDFKGDWEAFDKAEEAYVEQVKEYARKYGKGKLKGEEVSFPHADGHARYIVFEPSKLYHLAVGDAWQAPIAEYITAKGIREAVERDKAMVSIFASRTK